MRCLGLCAASQRGRTECVPPRKPPFASSGGSARQATGLGPGLPPEGRAPHARSDGIGLAGACPIWPPGVRFPPIIMLCLGMSKALPRGRGDRAPPRKSPSASAPGFPREAILAWIAPAEGRAPHAPETSEVSSPSPRSSQTRSSNEMPLTFKAVSVLLPIESSGSPRIVRN
jgi:hypothetical protein